MKTRRTKPYVLGNNARLVSRPCVFSLTARLRKKKKKGENAENLPTMFNIRPGSCGRRCLCRHPLKRRVIPYTLVSSVNTGFSLVWGGGWWWGGGGCCSSEKFLLRGRRQRRGREKKSQNISVLAEFILILSHSRRRHRLTSLPLGRERARGRSRLAVCRMKTREAHLLALDITRKNIYEKKKNPFPDLDISRHQKKKNVLFCLGARQLPVCSAVPLWLKLDVLVIGMKKSLSVDIQGRIPPQPLPCPPPHHPFSSSSSSSYSRQGEVNLYFSVLGPALLRKWIQLKCRAARIVIAALSLCRERPWQSSQMAVFSGGIKHMN